MRNFLDDEDGPISPYGNLPYRQSNPKREDDFIDEDVPLKSEFQIEFEKSDPVGASTLDQNLAHIEETLAPTLEKLNDLLKKYNRMKIKLETTLINKLNAKFIITFLGLIPKISTIQKYLQSIHYSQLKYQSKIRKQRFNNPNGDLDINKELNELMNDLDFLPDEDDDLELTLSPKKLLRIYYRLKEIYSRKLENYELVNIDEVLTKIKEIEKNLEG